MKNYSSQQIPDRLKLSKQEFLQTYLSNNIQLPVELANEFIEFVYFKHEDFNRDLLMQEVKKAMRIHMHLNLPKKDKERDRLV